MYIALYIMICIWSVSSEQTNKPIENNFSKVDNLMFTSYEGNSCFIIPKLTVLLYRSYSKMFII